MTVCNSICDPFCEWVWVCVCLQPFYTLHCDFIVTSYSTSVRFFSTAKSKIPPHRHTSHTTGEKIWAQCTGLAAGDRWVNCSLSEGDWDTQADTRSHHTRAPHNAILAVCQPSLRSESLWTDLAALTIRHTAKCFRCLFHPARLLKLGEWVFWRI